VRLAFLPRLTVYLEGPFARERESITLSGVTVLLNADPDVIGHTANLMEWPLHPRGVDYASSTVACIQPTVYRPGDQGIAAAWHGRREYVDTITDTTQAPNLTP